MCQGQGQICLSLFEPTHKGDQPQFCDKVYHVTNRYKDHFKIIVELLFKGRLQKQSPISCSSPFIIHNILKAIGDQPPSFLVPQIYVEDDRCRIQAQKLAIRAKIAHLQKQRSPTD